MRISTDRRAAVKKLKSLVLSSKSDVDSFRVKLDKKFRVEFLPNRVELAQRNYSGVKCDFLVPEIYAANRIMIYIHGGSFVGGSRESYRGFCSVLANASSARLVLPEFRLAPSYTFPSSIEDVETVLAGVMKEFTVKGENGMESRPEIILAADGSGATMATAVAYRMESRKRSCISKIVLFSPWLDLAPDSPTLAKKSRDEILTAEDLRHAADIYTYSSNILNRQVSPLRGTSEELENFPEVYIQCGGRELLALQAEEFHDLLKTNGIKCTLDITSDMMYMFQMADEFLVESHEAVERAGNFINRQEGLTPSEEEERHRLVKENNITTE